MVSKNKAIDLTKADALLKSLEPKDGVFIVVYRGETEGFEVEIPQLGLMQPGTVERNMMFILRSLMTARAQAYTKETYNVTAEHVNEPDEQRIYHDSTAVEDDPQVDDEPLTDE